MSTCELPPAYAGLWAARQHSGSSGWRENGWWTASRKMGRADMSPCLSSGIVARGLGMCHRQTSAETDRAGFEKLAEIGHERIETGHVGAHEPAAARQRPNGRAAGGRNPLDLESDAIGATRGVRFGEALRRGPALLREERFLVRSDLNTSWLPVPVPVHRRQSTERRSEEVPGIDVRSARGISPVVRSSHPVDSDAC